MAKHGGVSTWMAVGGSTHEVSPAAFGVVASWVHSLRLMLHGASNTVEE